MSYVEVRRARPALGTLLQIRARGPDTTKVEAAVEAAVAAVEQTEKLMSFHDADSELSRLNREAHRRPVAVHPWTYAVLRRATRMSAASEGLFDITVAPTLMSVGALPHAFPTPKEQGDWRSVVLVGKRMVRFTHEVVLDLGGIAKGFAVDVAFQRLRCGGCAEAIVNAGGDLRLHALEPEPIYLRTEQGLTRVAELTRGAVASSAAYRSDTDAIGCIVDPRHAEAWNGPERVMVAAPTCVLADALTKIAALAGPSSSPLLRRFGAQGFWSS